MADERRGGGPRRQGGRSQEGRPQAGRPQAGRPQRDAQRGAPRGARGGAPRDDASSREGGQRGQGARGGRPDARSGVAGRGRSGRDRVEERPRRTADQAEYDGPPIPEGITGQELDRAVLAQLRGLPEKLALRVARHLVAAGRSLEEDPETAYRHALAARARAARVAVVREAAGEAAYAAGHYAEALAELRAARRMNGAVDHLPVMADCERALGRPERALELAKSPAVARLSRDLRAEMTIVEAGARADLNELDGALRVLEAAPLSSSAREDWVVRLRYMYADVLLRAGRREHAIQWFHRTAAVDGDGITDAAERAQQLEAADDAGHTASS